MSIRVTPTPYLESLTQRSAPNLAALQDAAKLGFDAIECGESLALRTNQDIVDFVRQAGHKGVPQPDDIGTRACTTCLR